MLLKKQTVWLLTMLSLVVVLSVYYVTTPPQKENSLATTVEKEKQKETAKDTSSENKSEQSAKDTLKEVIPSEDESFQTVRMEITDERNKTIEDLQGMVGNTELSAEERDKANETIKQLRSISDKEIMLEGLIGDMNYDDVLVRADNDDNVRVTVKGDKLSASAANDIIRLVSGEIPNAQDVSVEFQPKQ